MNLSEISIERAFSTMSIDYVLDESTIRLVCDILSMIESEECTKGRYLEITQQVRNLGTETITLLLNQCNKELRNEKTDLQLRENINILAHYSTTNFRESDEYYIQKLGEFLFSLTS